MKNLISVSLLALALTVCGCSKEVDPKIGQPGEVMLLQGAKDQCLVAGAPDAYSERVVASGQASGSLLQNGALFFVPNKTEIKVVQVLGEPADMDRANYRKVEILSGEKKGKTAFVSIKSLQAKPK